MTNKRYTNEQKAAILDMANAIGIKPAAAKLGIHFVTISKWRADRQKKASPLPVLCQCGEVATEQVRLSNGRDTWTEWLCPGCAELERRQQDLTAGRGEERRGLWR